MRDDLSPSEAARRIGTSTRTVQRWIRTGRLPAARVGARWRVANDAIDAFVRAGAPRGVSGGPLSTVFVANRGEIARRIRRTCDALGIRAVLPATEGPAALDLMDPKAVVAAAVSAGADAIHPGFGFLAENAEFAEATISSGLRWVGPPPHAIRVMGDKSAARRLAVSLGIPVMPGYDGDEQSDEALIGAAEAIGFPLLVKPSAGGGGKGMRTVREPGALVDSLAAARREALTAFGDDRLILERLAEGARHVEVQVLFDAHGSGVSLGERDCSVQRRHQKVLEEAPSPGIDSGNRDRMGAAAIRLARAVDYEGAGTCEFLVDDRGAFTFLEMNTRLQVEHPVTEMVTGIDLVAEQLRIAAGEPMSPAVHSASPTGHVVEVRLYAEDAEAGFLPSLGRIEALRWPSGDGIRVDSGIDVGAEVSGRFDPMLAKVIAWGPDRGAALGRLAGALDDTLVLGVVTNLRFLRWLVRQPVVTDGQARTNTLERIWPPDDWAERTAVPEQAWSRTAAALAAGADPADPWSGGWRLNGSQTVRLEAEGSERTVEVGEASVGSDEAPTIVLSLDGATAHVDLAGRSVAFRIAQPPDVDRAMRTAMLHGAAQAGTSDVLAPMPGNVLAVHAGVGDLVDAGDPIATIEAMKMEHVVATPVGGRIGEIRVRPADQVTRGQLLATVEPAHG